MPLSVGSCTTSKKSSSSNYDIRGLKIKVLFQYSLHSLTSGQSFKLSNFCRVLLICVKPKIRLPMWIFASFAVNQLDDAKFDVETLTDLVMIKDQRQSGSIITNWALFQCLFEILILVVGVEVAEVEADKYEHEYPLGHLMIRFVFA